MARFRFADPGCKWHEVVANSPDGYAPDYFGYRRVLLAVGGGYYNPSRTVPYMVYVIRRYCRIYRISAKDGYWTLMELAERLEQKMPTGAINPLADKAVKKLTMNSKGYVERNVEIVMGRIMPLAPISGLAMDIEPDSTCPYCGGPAGGTRMPDTEFWDLGWRRLTFLREFWEERSCRDMRCRQLKPVIDNYRKRVHCKPPYLFRYMRSREARQ